MVRLARYVVLSTVGASAVVYHAFRTRQQFYPAMVYLSNSKICLLVLLNMALVILCAVWQLIKTVFLGSLREAELERLNEQSWREVMEILFAMTIFREEFCVSFVARITVLLFIKAFHWLAQKRVEYIETTPSVPRLSHLRIIFFMVLLLSLDSLFLRHSIAHLLRTKDPSVSMFFAFEYTILATSTMATFVKYALYVGDMVMDGQWDNKAVYIFYLELVRDLIHLSLYLLFFFAIFMYYGLPLHLVRELYETFRSFKARVADFLRYRRITSNMNDRFPDATAEELGRGDATCIICREEMIAAKKLPCGHLFHVHCLRSWLERQQTCPTCRAPVLVPENAADAAAGSGSSQANRAAEGQGRAPEGNAQYYVGGNLSPQHQERLQAAVAAAAQYNSSFVYPPLGTGNWCLVSVPLLHPAYRAAGAGHNGMEGRTVAPESTQETEQVSGDSNLAEGPTAQQLPPGIVGSSPSGRVQYVPAPPLFGLYQVPHGYWPAPRSARASNIVGPDGGIPAIPLGDNEFISLLEPHLRQPEARLRSANNGAGEEADGGRVLPPDRALRSFLDQVLRQQEQNLKQRLEAVAQQRTELRTVMRDKDVTAQQPISSTEVAREESGGPTTSETEAGRKGKAPIDVGEADARVEASTSAGA